MARPRNVPRALRRVLTVLLVLLAGHLPAADAWRIEGATVLAGDPGHPRVIERGRVLVRDGLIRAVAGPEEELPPEAHLARRIDAEGLLLHPAYIDALTRAGIDGRRATSRSAGEDPDRAAGPLAATREARRNGIVPERRAIDAWDPDEKLLARWRKQGFAALGVAESGARLAGRIGLVVLSGAPLRDAVVRADVAQHATFTRRGSGYPGSLMGAIAQIRQVVHDARHHREWRTRWEHAPRGLPRPPYDEALEALGPVVAGTQRVIWDTPDAGDVRRALRLGEELGLSVVPAVRRQLPRVVERIVEGPRSVILLPEAGEAPEVETGPGELPRRLQEDRRARWEREVSAAGELASAGVRFAFGTGGRGDPGRLVAEVRRSVEHGLPPRAALRALTLGAAEALGAAGVLGSVEPGKSACLILRDLPEEGGRLDLGTRVREVWVDGRRFEVAPRDAEEEEEEEEKPETEKEKAEEEDEEKEKPKEKEQEEPGKELPVELDTDRVPELRTGGDVLVRGATVLPMTGEVLEATDIRVEDGRIAELGRDLAVPEGTAVIDATGWWVIPGIVDAHSHLATAGGFNESTESVTCEVRIRDVLDPDDIGLYRAAAGGCTTSNILHGSANTIGGQNCIVRNIYRAPPEEIVFPGAPPGVKFALGENVRRRGRSGRFPRSRMGVEAVFQRAFEAAREYRRRAEARARARVQGEPVPPLRRDFRLEALLEILDGRRHIHTHCYRSDEILMMLRVAREEGLELRTLQHVLEGYKVAPEIALAGVGASTFSDWWAYKLEAYDAIPHNASMMHRAGVRVSVNSDSPELVRHLNLEAAKAVRCGGLSAEQALRLVTRNPAEQLRIDRWVGTIEPGKDADLAIFDAHPLSVYARCRITLIRGEVVFQRSGDRSGDARAPAHPPNVQRQPVSLPPAEPERSPSGVWALHGARVVPVGGGTGIIDPGTVVIRDGRIAAVGRSGEVEVPDEARVLELDGRWVLPGLVDAGSGLGLTEIGSVPGSEDRREIGEFQPDLFAGTAFHLHSELVPVAREGGVTSTAVFFSGPHVSGQAAWARLAGESSEDAVLRSRAALHVDLGRVRRDEEEPEVARELERWFRRAREHAERRSRAAGEGLPEPSARPKLEAMEPYLDGELPVVFSARTEPAVRLAAELIGRLEVRGVIRDGRDAWKAADLLAEKGIPVIVGPVLSLPTERFDPYDAPYANAGRLHAAGVPIAFQSAHASLVGNLPYHAGTAVAYGLPWEAAVEALTLGAARIYGLDDELGSLEPGKRADIIVTDGDPLEVTTRVLRVFVDGRAVSLDNRHRRLRRDFLPRIGPRREEL